MSKTMAHFSLFLRQIPRICRVHCNKAQVRYFASVQPLTHQRFEFLVPKMARQLSKRPPKEESPLKVRVMADSESDSESDSDSDEEFIAPRGESAFWRRKMRTFHSILDVNKDGVISIDDFFLLSERLTTLAHMTERHSEEYNALMEEIWEMQYGPLTQYNLVTTEQFLDEMHHALNDKCLRKKMHLSLPYYFKAIDRNRTGVITIDEYKLFFKCLGLSDADAVLAFNAIDINGDGILTKKEFVRLGKEFFISEDETKISKWFWGQLVL